MRDTTKNTVPNGSNNKRKRETIIDDAENINSQSISNQISTSVPLKRVFGSVLSDVTNLHPSVGRLTNQTGQLSSLNAFAVSGTTMVMHILRCYAIIYVLVCQNLRKTDYNFDIFICFKIKGKEG